MVDDNEETMLLKGIILNANHFKTIYPFSIEISPNSYNLLIDPMSMLSLSADMPLFFAFLIA